MTEDRYLPRIVKNDGYIAELRKAGKTFPCKECPELIQKGEYHYSITIAGGGLGSLKFPDRTHTKCLGVFLERRRGQ